LCLGTNALAQNAPTTLRELAASLEPTVDGWELSAERAVYGRQDLFDYINGGAELYLSYAFERMYALTYVKEASPEIKVDIFDMGSPESAFGVFTHSREVIDRFVAPDVESEYAGGLLTFWKGSFYVSILGYPETAERREVIRKVAQHIADQIAQKSERPALLNLLPTEGLLPLSARFFRHHLWQNSYGLLAQENVLHIGADTDAVLAKYRLQEEAADTAILLLVAYPDPAGAQRALASYGGYSLGTLGEGLRQKPDGTWSGGQVDGRYLSIVFNVPNAEQASLLLAQVSGRILRDRYRNHGEYR
jgi:hypothetical protein